jgi:predicted acylesterase/phospholipase RssA
VSSVLSALQDSTIRKDTSDIFSDHLLCLAGASGGSLGNATFYSLLKTKRRGDATYLQDSRAFLKADFLTPVITHWLGSDFIQHLIPLPVDDRAASLEQAMEYFADKNLDSTFARPLTRMLDVTGRLPILFINATHLQQGAPAVVSSIKLKQFSKRLDVLDSVEKTFLTEDKGDIRFSTAVVLGARFPYVSPAGSIGKEYFVDGGYFDNTGAGVVHEMMQMLDSVIKVDPTLYAKLNFKLVYISNSSLRALNDKLIHPVVDDLAAPVLTVLGTYASQTSVNNERLLTFMRRIEPADPYLEIYLYTRKDSIDYPMNWVISDYNLNRMNQRLEGVKGRELKELY